MLVLVGVGAVRIIEGTVKRHIGGQTLHAGDRSEDASPGSWTNLGFRSLDTVS